MTDTTTIPTRADVEKLKRNWAEDACWDIEDTEGFEAYRDELLAFSQQKEKEWKADRRREIKACADRHNVSIEDAEKILALEVGIENMVRSTAGAFAYSLREAGVALETSEVEDFIDRIAEIAVTKTEYRRIKDKGVTHD